MTDKSQQPPAEKMECKVCGQMVDKISGTAAGFLGGDPRWRCRSCWEKEKQPPPVIAEGLIEFLQLAEPVWATKLTAERLTFTRLLANAQRENELLKEQLKKPAPHGGPDLRSSDLVEQCRRLAVRRMTAWTKEDDEQSQDFRDGIEKAASDIACAISQLAP